MNLDHLLDMVESMPRRGGVSVSADQRRVLEPTTGPLWVIAGPGSGKTETLVLRCLRLIFVDRVNPKSVMLTTFTDKAAREIQDRLGGYSSWIVGKSEPAEVADIDATHVRVGTLHSLCNDIMREYRYAPYQNVRLMDELEQLIFINEHSELVNRRPGRVEQQLWATFEGLLGGWESVSVARRMQTKLFRAIAFRNLVNRIAEYRVEVERLERAGGIWLCLADGYAEYLFSLRRTGRSDFSHVQVLFNEFLRHPKGQLFAHGDGSQEHPGITHVLVDEYQDTNPIQEAIYLQLAQAPPHNLLVVGDDDQAIYRFRGGTVESLITFDEAIRRVWSLGGQAIRPIPLFENFRSHSRIVAWCNQFITSDPLMSVPGARAPGKRPLVARAKLNAKLGDYPSVNVISGPKVQDLARVFATTVRELLDTNTIAHPSSCALLLRSTRETGPWAGHYATALRGQGIEPYNPRGKTFLQQAEVRAALGAFVTVLDPHLDQCPTGRIQSLVRTWTNAYAAIASASPALRDYVLRSQAQIASKPGMTILNLRAMDLFYVLLSFSPFTDWQQDVERTVRLARLTQILEAYTSMPQPNNPEQTRNIVSTAEDGHAVSRRWRAAFYWGLVSILEQEQMDDEEDEYDPFPVDRLPFLTIFQAKGLEFPFVFVATKTSDAPTTSAAHEAEDLLHPFRAEAPHRVFDAAQRAVQDYARLFYVAHSRAQYSLTILATNDQLANDAPHLGRGGGTWISEHGGDDLTLLPVLI